MLFNMAGQYVLGDGIAIGSGFRGYANGDISQASGNLTLGIR